jgi:hypothetical protein
VGLNATLRHVLRCVLPFFILLLLYCQLLPAGCGTKQMSMQVPCPDSALAGDGTALMGQRDQRHYARSAARINS